MEEPDAVSSRFVGTWSLESFHAITPTGELVHPLGESVVGRITYHADGQMSVQVMSEKRPRFSTDDPWEAPPEELVEAFHTYIGYLGTYTVDPEANEVTHELEVASIPNWTGSKQVRRYKFGDGTLRLSTPPMQIGGGQIESVLLWRRD